MGYLKFLGLTLLVLLAVSVAIKLSAPAAVLMILASSVASAWRYGSRVMGVSYACWVALVVAWEILIKAVERGAPDVIAKYRPEQVHMAEGFWLLVGMVLLHPLCYGIGKLVARRRGEASCTSRDSYATGPGLQRQDCGIDISPMEARPIQTILLPVAADPPSIAAAMRAAGLARRTGARVLLLHVVSPETASLDFGRLQQELAPLLDGVAVTALLRRGPPAREILAAAREEGADLILMARHARWGNANALGFPRFLLHSVLCRVLLDALCPVWVEPEGVAPLHITRILCGVASLVHDRETITRAGGFAASLDAGLALFRCALSAAIDVPGQRNWTETMQKDVVVAVAADLETVRGELAVPGDIRVGIGGFVPALLQEAQAADLLAVRRTSREWGRDETVNLLVRGAAMPVLVFPGAPPRIVARMPARKRNPHLVRWSGFALLLLSLLFGVWLMHHTFRMAHGADCKAQPELCPVLNGYLNTARERGVDKPQQKGSAGK
jgi:nucleotide-binding universal stress UspA family protein